MTGFQGKPTLQLENLERNNLIWYWNLRNQEGTNRMEWPHVQYSSLMSLNVFFISPETTSLGTQPKSKLVFSFLYLSTCCYLYPKMVFLACFYIKHIHWVVFLLDERFFPKPDQLFPLLSHDCQWLCLLCTLPTALPLDPSCDHWHTSAEQLDRVRSSDQGQRPEFRAQIGINSITLALFTSATP